MTHLCGLDPRLFLCSRTPSLLHSRLELALVRLLLAQLLRSPLEQTISVPRSLVGQVGIIRQCAGSVVRQCPEDAIRNQLHSPPLRVWTHFAAC